MRAQSHAAESTVRGEAQAELSDVDAPHGAEHTVGLQKQFEMILGQRLSLAEVLGHGPMATFQRQGMRDEGLTSLTW